MLEVVEYFFLYVGYAGHFLEPEEKLVPDLKEVDSNFLEYFQVNVFFKANEMLDANNWA